MSLNVMMNAKVMKGLEEMFQANTTETIKMLSAKYGFDLAEALEELNVAEQVKIVKGKMKEVKEVKEEKAKVVKEKKGKTEKKEVPKMVLPFCGRVVVEWCEGVKMNHGLYSQCVNEKSASGEKYCKTCKKQAEGNESGKPTLGDISERMSVSSEAYRAGKGKKCVVYAVVMKKLKIEKAEAVAEALKFGLEIPAEEFEMPKSQRGRPKKLSESESVKSGSDDGEKKRRGRPKKNKTVAATTSDDTDDLIASLVAEANLLKSSSASASEAEASDAEASDAEDEAEDEAEASEAEDEAEESVESVEWEPSLLEKIVAKVSADATFNKLNGMVVGKKERKNHLKAIGDHIKSILTEEEMALYTGVPEEDAEESSEEEGEPEEDEASRKAREAAEKKAREAEEKKAQAKQKKEQADLEKKQKKEQADLEKKAKAEADKKLKAEADAEKKAQAELEKKQKKEQADLEKKAKAEADKKEKKPAEKKGKKAAEKKATKAAEVTPAVKEAGDEELQEEAPSASEAVTSEAVTSEAVTSEAVTSEAVTSASEAVTSEAVAVAVAVAEAEAEPVAAVNAKVFEFKGKKYLKTEEGILYDKETEECVGVWNEETNSIDDFADDEE